MFPQSNPYIIGVPGLRARRTGAYVLGVKRDMQAHRNIWYRKFSMKVFFIVFTQHQEALEGEDGEAHARAQDRGPEGEMGICVTLRRIMNWCNRGKLFTLSCCFASCFYFLTDAAD